MLSLLYSTLPNRRQHVQSEASCCGLLHSKCECVMASSYLAIALSIKAEATFVVKDPLVTGSMYINLQWYDKHFFYMKAKECSNVVAEIVSLNFTYLCSVQCGINDLLYNDVFVICLMFIHVDAMHD
jgi:hypothetical protein